MASADPKYAWWDLKYVSRDTGALSWDPKYASQDPKYASAEPGGSTSEQGDPSKKPIWGRRELFLRGNELESRSLGVRGSFSIGTNASAVCNRWGNLGLGHVQLILKFRLLQHVRSNSKLVLKTN